MVNGQIIREPDFYGRTTNLPKTWPIQPVLTPIYKYAMDNWIWVWLKTLEQCSKKSGLHSKIKLQLLSYQRKIQWMVNGRIIRELDSYGWTTGLPKTWLTQLVLTPIYKYAMDNWIWVWLKTPEKCSKKVDCIVKSSYSFWVTNAKSNGWLMDGLSVNLTSTDGQQNYPKLDPPDPCSPLFTSMLLTTGFEFG